MRRRFLALSPLWVLASACTDPSSEVCGLDASESSVDAYADCVVEFPGIEQSDFNHDQLPGIVLGPPRGSLDVASLGCEGIISLGFEAPGIVDGPGPDIIVFENPFSVDFPEPGEVSVSADGERWHTFDCDPLTLEGCAGVTPVLAFEQSELSTTNPETAGGDAFDLGELGLDEVSYVRIQDRSRAYWADLGDDYCDPGQQGKGGFDLDAVAAVHGTP